MNKTLLNILLLGSIVLSVTLDSCKKDDDNPGGTTPPSTGKTGTFTDSRDNHVYEYVEIGSQTWMSENLAYMGTDIQNIEDNFDWYDNSTLDAWCYYENSASTGTQFGVLYQWEAAKIACPDGWHLPTEAEWKQLENYLKDNGYAYDGVVGNDKVAKSLGAGTGWKSSVNLGVIGNTDFSNYVNITGFSARPGGFRAFTGEFVKKGEEAYWWCNTDDGSTATNRVLTYDFPKLQTFHDNKLYGFSVRCVKD